MKNFNKSLESYFSKIKNQSFFFSQINDKGLLMDKKGIVSVSFLYL